MMIGFVFMLAMIAFMWLALGGMPKTTLEWGLLLIPGIASFLVYNTVNRVSWNYIQQHEPEKYKKLRNEEGGIVHLLLIGIVAAIFAWLMGWL